MLRSIWLFLFVTAASCSKKIGEFFPAPKSTKDSLIVITGDGNHKAVVQYDLDGNFIKVITHFRGQNYTLRGLAAFDSSSFILSTDWTDTLFKINLSGEVSTFYGSNQLSGAIYDVERGPDNRYYVIESDRIEVFDSEGNRLSSTLINTTIGACTLSGPRGLAFNSQGQLVVTNYTSGEILTYDVSRDTASCVSVVSLGNGPYGIVAHSNGKLYIGTFTDDQVYETDADGSNAAAIYAITNPTSLVELPNGNLLVAGSTDDTVVQIKTDGTQVGTDPFIEDPLSLNIQDMLIIEGEE